MRVFVLALSALCGLVVVDSARAQVYRPYDGIQAGLDAYRLAEERRQAAVANQLGTNDVVRISSGLPPTRGHTAYYGYSWPVVPYGIYGFTYVQPVRQPIGRWEGQTGPNRWESHPVYAPPLPWYEPQPIVQPLVEPPVEPLVKPKIVGPPAADESIPPVPEILDEVPPEPPTAPLPPMRRGREF